MIQDVEHRTVKEAHKKKKNILMYKGVRPKFICYVEYLRIHCSPHGIVRNIIHIHGLPRVK